MHYHLHESITAVRFFCIGRAITEHREGGFSFAPTLFSGSLCRSLPTCMTHVCLPVQGCAGSAGRSAGSARSAGKNVSRFQHYLHCVTYEYQHITIKECKMQAICAKKVCRGVIGAQNASTNGGDASRVGERCSCYLVELVCFSFIFPTRDASPPLEVAFGGSVLMIAFYASV